MPITRGNVKDVVLEKGGPDYYPDLFGANATGIFVQDHFEDDLALFDVATGKKLATHELPEPYVSGFLIGGAHAAGESVALSTGTDVLMYDGKTAPTRVLHAAHNRIAHDGKSLFWTSELGVFRR